MTQEELNALLSTDAPDTGSMESMRNKVIELPGRYLFRILSAKLGDSRTISSGEPKRWLPTEYTDETKEITMVLQDVESKEVWFEHMSIQAFRKFANLDESTKKALKPLNLSGDNRDGYAVITDPKTKVRRRLVAQVGSSEYEGLLNIWSDFCAATDLPLGTTFSEYELLKGHSFWGTLQKRAYMGRDKDTGEEIKKEGLKLLPNFYAPTDAEREAIEELSGAVEEFKENV